MTFSGQPMLCRNCRYDLRGITTNQCPECGTEFDPSDPSTWYVKRRRLNKRKSASLWWALLGMPMSYGLLILLMLPHIEFGSQYSVLHNIWFHVFGLILFGTPFGVLLSCILLFSMWLIRR